MGQDGYASLRDVLKHDSLNELGVTQRELEEVAQSNDTNCSGAEDTCISRHDRDIRYLSRTT